MALNRSFLVAVEEASQVAEARREAAIVAERLDFSPTRIGQVALVATELATNLVRHATGGELLIRACDDGSGRPADTVELLSVDRGPGIADVERSRRDGYSTGGTAGAGLGAVERQSDQCEIYSDRSGTIVLARLARIAPRTVSKRAAIELGSIMAPKRGELVSGDDWCWRLRGDRLALLLADGLGHGLQAHEAARAAADCFAAVHEHPPARIIADIHAALRPTRGAAVAVLVADFGLGLIRYCGLGNIAAQVLGRGGARQTLVSHAGTAGHTAARIQEFTYPLSPEALIVMHSDGLSANWDLGPYAGLRSRHPSLVGGAIYRDFNRGRDDATVVTAGRYPQPG